MYDDKIGEKFSAFIVWSLDKNSRPYICKFAKLVNYFEYFYYVTVKEVLGFQKRSRNQSERPV